MDKAFLVGDSLRIDPLNQVIEFEVEHEKFGVRFRVTLQSVTGDNCTQGVKIEQVK